MYIKYIKSNLSEKFRTAVLGEQVAFLTIFLLCFHQFRFDVFEPLICTVFLLSIWSREWLKSPWLWLIMGGSGIYYVFNDYYGTDNHKWLYMYWIWTLILAFSEKEIAKRNELLAFNARFFLVVSMGLATFWKIVSPDFMSGAFMEYSLMTNSKFDDFIIFFGIDPKLLENTHELIGELPFEHNAKVTLEIPLAITYFGWFSTFWVILCEGILAVLFFWNEKKTDIFAHTLLLIFIYSTYIAAPVIGFGIILCILGMTLAWDRKLVFWVYAYLFGIILLSFYDYIR